MEKEYNNRPELRFFGYNTEWQKRKIGEITQIYDGTHQTPNYQKNGIKFLSVENIKDITKTKKFISRDDFESDFKIKPMSGDVLMTRIGDIGTSILLTDNTEYAFYVTLSLIRSNKFILNPSYLNHYISTKRFQKELFSRTLHVAFPKKINLGEISDCEVEFPNIDEQMKIASFFTLIDQSIENIEEKLRLLEGQKKGIMQNIFSQEIAFKNIKKIDYKKWITIKLGEISSVTNGKGDVQDALSNGKYPFFDRSSVIKHVDEYLFEGEAIIYPGEGSEFYPRYFSGKYGLHQRCYTINTFDLEKSYPKYIYYYLYTQSNYFSKIAVGSTVKSLRMDNFSNISILLPEVEEQIRIAEFFSILDQRIENVKLILIHKKNLKKSLLQKMFI